MTRAFLLLTLLAPTLAVAQPKPVDKLDAKSLMQSGVKLLEAKDYLGALAVFKEAYERFPSTKILLNIGTTLKLLDRKADAANTYQRYLDAADADPAKKAEVESALAELDKAVGRLEVTITPADAEVQVDDDDWGPLKNHLVRVTDGAFTVRARKNGFKTEAKSASIAPGEKAAVVIAMTAEPTEDLAPQHPMPRDTGVHDEVAAPETVSRFGAVGLVLLDIPRGAAGLGGLRVDATESLTLRAAAILGPTYGAYAGATFTIGHGSVRPMLSGAIPVFFSNGERWVVRGAGGVEIPANKHVSIVVELGYEHYLNPEMGLKSDLFVPAVGLDGRL